MIKIQGLICYKLSLCDGAKYNVRIDSKLFVVILYLLWPLWLHISLCSRFKSVIFVPLHYECFISTNCCRICILLFYKFNREFCRVYDVVMCENRSFSIFRPSIYSSTFVNHTNLYITGSSSGEYGLLFFNISHYGF